MDIRWALTDGRDVYDGFDGYLDLNGQTAEIRKAIRSEINEAI